MEETKDMFDEKIIMLQAYKEVYDVLSRNYSWYEVEDEEDDSVYKKCHRIAFEKTMDAVKKFAGI